MTIIEIFSSLQNRWTESWINDLNIITANFELYPFKACPVSPLRFPLFPLMENLLFCSTTLLSGESNSQDIRIYYGFFIRSNIMKCLLVLIYCCANLLLFCGALYMLAMIRKIECYISLLWGAIYCATYCNRRTKYSSLYRDIYRFIIGRRKRLISLSVIIAIAGW